MEFVNFTIGGQNIDLEWPNEGYADLHNDYDFSRLTYVSAEASLILLWKKSSGKWADNAPCQMIQLTFNNVSYFQLKERDSAYPVSEDSCLQSICRSPQSARDEFESIYFNKDAHDNYDLTLYFQSEWGIKVNSDTVYLKLE